MRKLGFWGLVAGVVAVLAFADGVQAAAPPGSARPAASLRVKAPHHPGPGPQSGPIRYGRTVIVPRHRTRHYRDVLVLRPNGHFYRGYGCFSSDDDAYKWLAFTAITLKLLDVLNEHQQRTHEAAQVRATTAAVGETVHWSDGSAAGSVTVLRDGTSSRGRYCREFQQEVIVGGEAERAYGTACRQPDGAWEIISTRS
ncbi:MAG TPA: hypothetical protein EYH07_06540 [Kiloniellaceae bacterium]|nr:hypothetical protein [Kiloniellaceae bacterium]